MALAVATNRDYALGVDILSFRSRYIGIVETNKPTQPTHNQNANTMLCELIYLHLESRYISIVETNISTQNN